ncbi:hypothetical protein DIPPA_21801 [Diplonema papillatum]|nr:hypothetical protein DIPPA_21801 [Diplonema papillatum]
MLLANRRMAAYCFHILEGRLKEWQPLPPPDFDVPEQHFVPGMFVGYTAEGTQLGCYGRYAPINLRDGLAEFALAAALDHPSFEPVTGDELSLLRCTVTTLSDTTLLATWDDWDVGDLGVHVTLRHGDAVFSGWLPPDIMLKFCLGRHQALNKILLDAGYRGPLSLDVYKQCEVRSFEASEESIEYGDYVLEFRDQWGFGLLQA